jgi:hypothetical protein
MVDTLKKGKVTDTQPVIAYMQSVVDSIDTALAPGKHKTAKLLLDKIKGWPIDKAGALPTVANFKMAARLCADKHGAPAGHGTLRWMAAAMYCRTDGATDTQIKTICSGQQKNVARDHNLGGSAGKFNRLIDKPAGKVRYRMRAGKGLDINKTKADKPAKS